VKSVLQNLDALGQALQQVASTLPVKKRTRAEKDLVSYIHAAKRKCQNVLWHQTIIAGVDWGRLDDLGRTSPLTGDTETLTIELPEASLIVRHRGAAVDQVYVAFDGFIAGIVNVTDTLGRLLNFCFDLQINDRGATLFAVRDKVKDSLLGQVLADPTRMNWLKGVRELRGQCQHAELEEVLVDSSGVLGRCEEPCVPYKFVWSNPPRDTPVTEYAAAVADKGEALVCDCIAIIVQHGTKATAPIYAKDLKARSTCQER